MAAAVLVGPSLGVDDPGPAPARVASDLLDGVPAGPGVFVATREPSWFAIAYAQAIAGTRPDLALAPPVAPESLDVAVAEALRHDRVAGADVDAFGRLDPGRAIPEGRGFQLLGAAPDRVVPVLPPARYASAIGVEQSHAARAGAGALRGERRTARCRGPSRRSDRAVRCCGPRPARRGRAFLEHPAFFGFIPALDGRSPGPWLLDLMCDDLAWVAGISDLAPMPPDAPPSRVLHSLWRQLWQGKIKSDDPAIARLGAAATSATSEMLAALHK